MSTLAATAPSAVPVGAVRAAGDRLGAQRAAAFLALAVFSSLSYSELLLHPPALRMLAVAVLATAGCAVLAVRRGDGRPLLPAALRPLVLLATLAVCLLALGVPARLLAPWHWSRLEHDLAGGLDGLGAWLWPYRGSSAWSQRAVLLVVPVALLAAGALCFWPGAGRARRAASLALLVGLFLAGAANAPQSEAGLRGLALLALIAAWLAPAPSGTGGAARAARWLVLPALLALLARPAISSSSAWIPFRDAPGTSSAVTSFQWDQTYGPIDWPRSEDTMLTVESPDPGLLRVTTLDRFDGLRFLRSDAVPRQTPLDEGIRTVRLRRGTGARARELTRSEPPPQAWFSRETVTIVDLRSRLLVGGDGLTVSLQWIGAATPTLSRQPDGTLAAASVPPRGVYSVVTYRPRPSAARLRRAPRGYPAGYLPYARFELPAAGASGLIQPRFASEARSRTPARRIVEPAVPGRAIWQEPAAARRVEGSPYGPMMRLARGLAAGAASSYDVAERLERFLLSNYTYDEHVPQARYPLEAFLFEQRRGYCQQFSGAMTLMLRMDGIPARVASGFKPSLYDSVAGTWRIRALDAHSWVEAFFSGIGWIAFDPTPAAPAQVTGTAAAAKDKSEILASSSAATPARPKHAVAAPVTTARNGGIGAGELAALAAGGIALLALGVLWLRGHLRLRRAFGVGAGPAVAELSLALRRSGLGERPQTLAQLERSLRDSGEETAASYVLALRERRYADLAAAPAAAPRGRGALRRALMRRGRRRAALRVLAAMPPGAMRGASP